MVGNEKYFIPRAKKLKKWYHVAAQKYYERWLDPIAFTYRSGQDKRRLGRVVLPAKRRDDWKYPCSGLSRVSKSVHPRNRSILPRSNTGCGPACARFRFGIGQAPVARIATVENRKSFSKKARACADVTRLRGCAEINCSRQLPK